MGVLLRLLKRRDMRGAVRDVDSFALQERVRGRHLRVSELAPIESKVL
jgi:hypothetical protein